MKPEDKKIAVKFLSTQQHYVLYLARYYKLKRSSLGWWVDGHPRWSHSHEVPHMVFQINTVASLRRKGLLDGDDNMVWANQCGIELLEDIKRDTGIFFDTETDQLIGDQVLN